MKFESPNPRETGAKSPENTFEQYQKESLAIAQSLSRKWHLLRAAKKENPNLLAGNPLLEEIDLATKPPLTGIQVWYQSRIKWVDAQSDDPGARIAMMYRVKEDLERIQEKFDDLDLLEATSAESTTKAERKNTKDILRRGDIDESGNKYFDVSLEQLLTKNNFQAGDKIIFFREREREGTLQKDDDGSLFIRDKEGNPWGLVAIMSHETGYIRRP